MTSLKDMVKYRDEFIEVSHAPSLPSPPLPSLLPLPFHHSPPTDTTCLQSCGLRLPIPGEEEEEEQLKGRRMDSAEREELLKEVRVPACVLECVHTNIDRCVDVSSDVEHFT